MGQIWLAILSIAKAYVEQITSDGYHNIQIQANNQAGNTSVRIVAPDTIATVLVKGEADLPVDPEEVRKALLESFENNSIKKLGSGPGTNPRAKSGAASKDYRK